jgi:hypothetical protein
VVSRRYAESVAPIVQLADHDELTNVSSDNGSASTRDTADVAVTLAVAVVMASATVSGVLGAFWLHEYEKPDTPRAVSVAPVPLIDTVGLLDHTPVRCVGETSVGLLGGVVSLTVIDSV